MRSFLRNPVRQIASSPRSIRGQLGSQKLGRAPQYESALERDLLLLLDFDTHVEFYCEQPVTIEYEHEGVTRHYTPDVLIYFRNDVEPARELKPLLCEVKYRADLKVHWSEWQPRFRAALRYAYTRGWQFKLVTEQEIRTEYLTNVRFLRHYTGPHARVTQTDQGYLLHLLQHIQFTTAEELLLMATTDRSKRAELLYTLWHLVAVGLIGCDLTTELSLQTEVWIP